MAFVLAGAPGGGASVEPDLMFDAPVPRAVLDRAKREGVAKAIAALGPERAATMLVPPRGAALADDPLEQRVLRSVEVMSVALQTVRIRVAGGDVIAGNSVADSIHKACPLRACASA